MRQISTGRTDSLLVLLKEGWHGNIIFLIRSNEHFIFKAEIEPDAFTCSWFDLCDFLFADEVEINVAQSVPLNRKCLDSAFDVAALEVAVLLFGYVDGAMPLIKLPASLFERIRLVLADFLKTWRCGLTFIVEICPEELIRLSMRSVTSCNACEPISLR